MDDIRKILAVRLGRLGDVILLMPALLTLKTRWPDVHLALVTDRRYAPAVALCPFVDEILPVDRLEMRDGPKLQAMLAMRRLILDTRAGAFDLALDFHGFCETQLMVWLSGVRHRAGLKRPGKIYLPFCFNRPGIPEDKAIHVSEMFKRVAEAVASPRAGPDPVKLLVPPAETAARIRSKLPAGPLLGLYVGARSRDYMWPAERFGALADLIVRQLGASVILLGGSSALERDTPYEAWRYSRQKQHVHAMPQLDIAELAAAISFCRLLVSNDSGPMHIGPAVGVQTLGLFSLSSPQHYAPIGPNDRHLRASNIRDISVDCVFNSTTQMWIGSAPEDVGG